MESILHDNIMEFIEENTFSPETPEGAKATWENPELLINAESKILEWLDAPSKETIMLCSDQLFIDIDDDQTWIELGRFPDLFHTRGRNKGKFKNITIFAAEVINPGTNLPLMLFEWNGYRLALLTHYNRGQSITWLHMRIEDFKKEIDF